MGMRPYSPDLDVGCWLQCADLVEIDLRRMYPGYVITRCPDPQGCVANVRVRRGMVWGEDGVRQLLEAGYVITYEPCWEGACDG